MKSRIRIICFLILLAAVLPGCSKYVPESEDPFRITALAPLKDNIPNAVLGSGKIVFDRCHQNGLDRSGFFVIDSDKNTVNGFRLNSQAVEPSISPDGTKIACSFLLMGGNSGWDIYIMNVDGSNCYRVFQAPYMAEWPTWTPDGSKVIFYVNGTGPLYMQSPVENATDRVELTKFFYTGDTYYILDPSGGFSMSPGGKLVCVNSYGPIRSIDPYVGKAGVRTVLPRTNLQNFESPVFSPGGEKIAFLSVEKDSLSGWKAVSVEIMNPDGTNLTQVGRVKTYQSPVDYTNWHRMANVSLCWSPDGKKILFTVPTEEYGCHIFVINSDGSGLTQVTDDVKAYDYDVSWSR